MTQLNTSRRLQLCRENALSRRADVLAALREAGWHLEVEECLDECTRCNTCALALVCGRMQFAPTPEAFLERLTVSPGGRNRSKQRGKKTGRGGGSNVTQ